MIDFEQNYKHRLAVYRAIQQSQKLESEIAEQIGKIAVNGKRELLLFLSAWLLEINSASSISATERSEIESMTQVSLENWVKLQAVAGQIEKDIQDAQTKEREAVAVLQKNAPYGAATKLFAGPEAKTQIQTLQGNISAIQKHRESLSDALQQNVSKRQSIGETFFRDCLTHLDKLTKSQTMGREISIIIARMTKEMNTAWAGHQKEQTQEFVQMAELVETLQNSYKDVPAALPHQATTLPPPEQQQETKQGVGK